MATAFIADVGGAGLASREDTFKGLCLPDL